MASHPAGIAVNLWAEVLEHPMAALCGLGLLLGLGILWALALPPGSEP